MRAIAVKYLKENFSRRGGIPRSGPEDKNEIRKKANGILDALDISEAEISIVFTDDDEMRRLNRQYRNEDSATDVLAFDLRSKSAKRSRMFGDIVISVDTAADNAKAYKTSLKEEIYFYMIHGILHLAGYDDGDGADREKMREKERKVFEKICQKNLPIA